MTSAPTVTMVLDGFLAARAAAASAPKFARSRDVIGSFRAYVEAHGAAPVDDLTACRLTRAAPGEPTEHELAAVLSVIEHVTGFFRSLEGGSAAPSAARAGAAEVVSDLADWLVQRRLVDGDVAEHLSRYTGFYVGGGQRTGS